MPQPRDDARFRDNAARIANRDALVEALEAVTRTLSRNEIEKRLLAAGVPASEVLPFIEMYTSDHANATHVTDFVWQEKVGQLRFYNNPLRFNNELCPIYSGAPLLGQHTTDVLRKAGYNDEEIQKLYDDGVVASSMI